MEHGPYFTMKEAKKVALRLSREQPRAYVTLEACFGMYVVVRERLHVFAPSDAWTGTYYHNGRERPFTTRQRIADQNATPTMA